MILMKASYICLYINFPLSSHICYKFQRLSVIGETFFSSNLRSTDEMFNVQIYKNTETWSFQNPELLPKQEYNKGVNIF